ncbi:MAG: Bicarbonate transport system permease protein CmpB [Chloroflexi bacterium ADurb.Bin325]|nr:MAG: Bicarbonate transport system permease protein CmpB [Chloroflexi bacterium ADurb.Bin325]
MAQSEHIFRSEQFAGRQFGRSDALVILAVATLIYGGARLAMQAPVVVEGRDISLAPTALPIYALFSVGRMLAAYALSFLFTLVYGYIAAYNRRAEAVLMPLLDVLQSVPILSFLPMVLLSLSAILPETIAVELASVVLIFTSQAWNMTFAWYQSLTTIPVELREASGIFRFNRWLRLKTLELPFGANSLIWNSMMSWAGGWFFLMAAEIFTVGQRDFRLPGLGAYLSEAAAQGDRRAILLGIGMLVLVIVMLDQFVWRPLIAWSERFKLEMVESDNPPTSWFLDQLRGSRLVERGLARFWRPLVERVDQWFIRRLAPLGLAQMGEGQPGLPAYALLIAVAAGVLYGAYRAAAMLLQVPLVEWGWIGVGLLATLLRVIAALVITLAWTIPVGVAIGTNERLARWLQPVVQVAASVPATALFPVVLLALLAAPGGLAVAALLLMLMGTQWYVLFNVIAGAAAIPQDLKYTAALLGLGRWERWRTLILPALFPFIVTGAITATGGAWNASIVAEHISYAGESYYTIGLGSLIARATADGNYPLLLAATLSMVLAVAALNRVFWRRLYRLAEDRFRME